MNKILTFSLDYLLWSIILNMSKRMKPLYFKIILPLSTRGGGTHIGKAYGDVPQSWPPFFQTSHRSLAYQFTINALFLCPLFSIFRKFLHFQPCFSQNSSSLDPNFSKFSFLRPLFFKENPLPRPYILKPVWHTSTKKKLSAPPPPPGLALTMIDVWVAEWISIFCY